MRPQKYTSIIIIIVIIIIIIIIITFIIIIIIIIIEVLSFPFIWTSKSQIIYFCFSHEYIFAE